MSTPTSMEPQAYGHVILKTTFGDLEIELFTKQCPKLTRNFVQLCLDGYYQDSVFNHVEKDFIAIGGVREAIDNLDDDTIRGSLGTFKDEFHSRLRFTRRGLLASANKEKDANGPEFFFTLGQTQELQNKHSIFGRLLGNSIYTLVDLNECHVDSDLLPLSEKKITEVKIMENPFPELKPRPEIVAILQSIQNVIERQEDPEPKFELKPDRKLTFFGEEEDDDDDDNDDSDNKSDNMPSKTIDLKTSPTEMQQDAAESNLKCQGAEVMTESDSKRVKLEETTITPTAEANQESAREKRLREIREQIRDFKKQLECESATKIRTLSERRGIARENGDSKQASSSDPSGAEMANVVSRSSYSKTRERERETRLVAENFSKKLRQATSETKDTDEIKPTGRIAAIETTDRLDDYDARFLEELDSVDGDSWLTHKFEAPVETVVGDDYRVPSSRNRQHSRDRRKKSPSDRSSESGEDRSSREISRDRHRRSHHSDEREQRKSSRSFDDRKRGRHENDRRHSSRRHDARDGSYDGGGGRNRLNEQTCFDGYGLDDSLQTVSQK